MKQQYLEEMKGYIKKNNLNNTIELLERLEEFCQKYDKTYVYKKCRNHRFVVLKHIPGVTITNKKRLDIVDPQNATYWGNKFYVECICHIYDVTQLYNEAKSIRDKKFIYKVGQCVEVESEYDERTDGSGIYHFLNPRAAFEYFLERAHNVIPFQGLLIQFEYYDNGRLKRMSSFWDGVRVGPFISLFENGRKGIEGRYCDGKRVSCWKYYYEDGRMSHEGSYLNDREYGIHHHNDLKCSILYDVSDYLKKGITKRQIEYSDGRIKEFMDFSPEHVRKMKSDEDYVKQMEKIYLN